MKNQFSDVLSKDMEEVRFYIFHIFCSLPIRFFSENGFEILDHSLDSLSSIVPFLSCGSCLAKILLLKTYQYGLEKKYYLSVRLLLTHTALCLQLFYTSLLTVFRPEITRDKISPSVLPISICASWFIPTSLHHQVIFGSLF